LYMVCLWGPGCIATQELKERINSKKNCFSMCGVLYSRCLCDTLSWVPRRNSRYIVFFRSPVTRRRVLFTD
jgi:hypothetical protein